MPEELTEEMKQRTTRFCKIRGTLYEMLRDRGYAAIKNEVEEGEAGAEFNVLLKRYTETDSVILLFYRVRNPLDPIYVEFNGRNKPYCTRRLQAFAERMQRDEVNRAILILGLGLTPYAKKGIENLHMGRLRIEVFLEKELLFNITRHVLQPKFEVLDTARKRVVLSHYNAKAWELPRMQKCDPVARYYGLNLGQVVKITRHSETAGVYVTYRIVVN